MSYFDPSSGRGEEQTRAGIARLRREEEARQAAARELERTHGSGGSGGGGSTPGGAYMLVAMLSTALAGVATLARTGSHWGSPNRPHDDGGYLGTAMLTTVALGLLALAETPPGQHPSHGGHRRAPDRAYSVADLSRTVQSGLVTMRGAGPLGRDPRAASLAFIDWYRASDRWAPCPTADLETHCSEHAWRAIETRGALRGWLSTVARVNRCRRAQGFRMAW